jgi:hypothetical protein
MTVSQMSIQNTTPENWERELKKEGLPEHLTLIC